MITTYNLLIEYQTYIQDFGFLAVEMTLGMELILLIPRICTLNATDFRVGGSWGVCKWSVQVRFLFLYLLHCFDLHFNSSSAENVVGAGAVIKSLVFFHVHDGWPGGWLVGWLVGWAGGGQQMNGWCWWWQQRDLPCLRQALHRRSRSCLFVHVHCIGKLCTSLI